LVGFHHDCVGEIGPIVDSSERHRNDLMKVLGPMFSLKSLYEASQTMEYDQLVRARDYSRNLLSLADTLFCNSAQTGGPPNAFGMAMAPFFPHTLQDKAITALMMARLEELLGRRQFESSWALLQPELARQEAFAGIIDQLPRPLGRYIGIQGSERQQRAGTEVLAQLRTRLDEIEAEHPELFEAVRTDSSKSN
jgi:hypothetical protein